ncbi:hypothetical protein CFP56_031840 [Quercus suber]|uniref:Uncharacterized protein n=1 Tax=Quercus suber TaxID=58331 RepID=A0AAW0LTV1_QUESU
MGLTHERLSQLLAFASFVKTRPPTTRGVGEDHTFTTATQSAIVALMEGRLNSSFLDTCTICLEDFPVGSSVTFSLVLISFISNALSSG